MTETQAFERDVIAGLSRETKSLSSRYFYDDEGSRIFQQIMNLEEYYLTGCEREILETRGSDIARRFPSSFSLIELGAGDGAKTAVLIDHLQRAEKKMEFRPVDLSEEAMRSLTARMRVRFPELPMEGIVADYLQGLGRVVSSEKRSVVLFLGSNIGNFAPDAACKFLAEIRWSLKPGDLFFIGFDLVKHPETLHRAYSDDSGVTAAFNLNLLTRINRELGGNFVREKFRHYAAYNFRIGAMESYLVSLEDQDVTLSGVGRTFHFERWEAVFTECSFKYTPTGIARLAEAGGFRIVEHFTDSRGYFCDSLWEVPGL